MPLIGTQGAASARGFGFLTSIGQAYWIGRMSNAGLASWGYGTATDSAGNMYVCGYREAATNDSYLVKFSPQGLILWQVALGNTNTSINYSVKVNASGDVYVGGFSGVSGNSVFQLSKYNSSGTLQWQKRLGPGSPLQAYGQSIALDPSGNIYICGRHDVGGNFDILLAKYNSSGVVQWQQRYGIGSGNEDRGEGIAVDASGNVYVTGYTNSNSSWDIVLLKYDTSGVLQWQRRAGNGTTDTAAAAAVDSSGSVYVCGTSNNTGANGLQIIKYNSSGTLQWQRVMTGGQASGLGIVVDSSDNIYACGISRYFGSDDMYVVKYNTSGTVQWQRRIGSNANSEEAISVAVDATGNVYLAGAARVSSVWNLMYVKIPANGSKTGTYTVGGVSYVYGSGALSDEVSTLASNTPGGSSSNPSLTATDSSLSSSTPALTTSVTQI